MPQRARRPHHIFKQEIQERSESRFGAGGVVHKGYSGLAAVVSAHYSSLAIRHSLKQNLWLEMSQPRRAPSAYGRGPS